jgi:leader peptidase (prepilin peptidase)/N-methyltransferase
VELSDWLARPAAIVVAGLFGALWGSFFNVCIARVPGGLSVVKPGSHCFACRAPVRPWDNIPILSYFLLRGRCRACGATFSIRYVLVEALTGGLAALVFWRFVTTTPALPPGVRLASFALYFAFAGVLVVLSFIDLDTKTLPDVITLPSIPILFLASFGAPTAPWLDRAIGGVAGFGFVWLVAEAYYYIRGREGLGLGDGKLLSMIGALLGWKALPIVVFLGSFLGILIAVPMLLMQRRRAPAPQPGGEGSAVGTDAPADPGAAGEPEALEPVRFAEVPFGPFLALAALVYLFVWSDLEAALGAVLVPG